MSRKVSVIAAPAATREPDKKSTPSSSRYLRQILFRPIGEEGQRRLGASRVTVIGIGALGTVIANNLARAGVGHLRLVDRDIVDRSNLQRQVLFDEEDAREQLPKVVAAARKLAGINSEISLEPIIADVSAGNVEELLESSDLAVDGTDNLETRFLLNDACVKAGRPWIYGGALASNGMTMTIVPGRTPCLRCFLEHPPDAGSMPSCDTEGVLGGVTGTIGSIESVEALRLLVGLEPVSTIVYVDLWAREYRDFSIDRRPDCPACGTREFEFLAGLKTSWTTVLCGRNAVQIVPPAGASVDLAELGRRLSRLGPASFNGFLLSFSAGGRNLVLFPDGRAIIHGTTDEAEARTLYARYIGQ